MQEPWTLGTFGVRFGIAALSLAVGCPAAKSQSWIQDGLGCSPRTVKENSPLPILSNMMETVAYYNMQRMSNINCGVGSMLGGVDDLGY